MLSTCPRLSRLWPLSLSLSLSLSRVFAAMGDSSSRVSMVSPDRALPGSVERMAVSAKHAVNGNPAVEPFPEGLQLATFGMGCFWGAERMLWTQSGVFSTQVGYSGGSTPNPSYKEVCSGLTGHTEVVRVVFNPNDTSFESLLKVFWESHNPTQDADNFRLWPDHHGDPDVRTILLRRGLPPAVPAQEPGGLLWLGGHWRLLPRGPEALR
ncbi:mitochondrial peptide methionine sulfoxide reductase isoform X3 [Lampetra planeri]